MSNTFKPYKVKAFNIRYDTDGKKVDGLKISDETGWCIFGCEFEIIK